MEWSVQEQGQRVTIYVKKRDEGDGLYKAWAVGEKGRFLLGTLVPEQGVLCLKRTVSVDRLQQQGAWPIRQVRAEQSYAFRNHSNQIMWTDEVLRQSAQNLPRYTLQKNGEGFLLWFPFDVHAPFPLVPVFCFARVVNGRLVFSFQKDGFPNILPNKGKNRE